MVINVPTIMCVIVFSLRNICSVVEILIFFSLNLSLVSTTLCTRSSSSLFCCDTPIDCNLVVNRCTGPDLNGSTFLFIPWLDIATVPDRRTRTESKPVNGHCQPTSVHALVNLPTTRECLICDNPLEVLYRVFGIKKA